MLSDFNKVQDLSVLTKEFSLANTLTKGIEQQVDGTKTEFSGFLSDPVAQESINTQENNAMLTTSIRTLGLN